MNKFVFTAGFIVTVFAQSVVIYAQDKGYNIEVKINGLPDSKIILGHYMADAMFPDDTLLLDKKGNGSFSGLNSLTGGLYFIYNATAGYFNIIMGADQYFSLETDTSNLAENLTVSGSTDNSIFTKFELYNHLKHEEMKELRAKLQQAEKDKEKELIKAEMNELNKERLSYTNNIIEENPDLFVSTFIKASIDIEVPDSIKKDAKRGYRYYKNHYFDNLDLSDVRLLYTPFYESKLMNYLDKVVVQIPDSLIAEIDIILEKSKADSLLYQIVLQKLFNKYSKSQYMGMDAISVHLGEEYYLEDSWWADEKFLKNLEERVTVMKPLLIGKIAPDIQLRYVPSEHFKQAANDTTLKRYPHAGSFINYKDLSKDYIVLIFWEATCSHCKKEITNLYKVYQDTLKSMNVEVVSVCTLFGKDGKEKWIDFVNKNKLYDWVNAWNPYDYKYKETYDVRTVPQVYIIDNKKEIMGKKISSAQVTDLISTHKKFHGL